MWNGGGGFSNNSLLCRKPRRWKKRRFIVTRKKYHMTLTVSKANTRKLSTPWVLIITKDRLVFV